MPYNNITQNDEGVSSQAHGGRGRQSRVDKRTASPHFPKLSLFSSYSDPSFSSFPSPSPPPPPPPSPLSLPPPPSPPSPPLLFSWAVLGLLVAVLGMSWGLELY